MTSKNRARTEISFHTLASEMVLRLCVIKIKMFIFLPLSLCNIFSALKMSRAEFTLPLMPSFFPPPVSSQLRGLQPTQTVPSHFAA